ncbi:MAG: hypothetical protein ACI9QD_000852 [Thermoproteota archaeon]|jgi:hypothetical protein
MKKLMILVLSFLSLTTHAVVNEEICRSEGFQYGGLNTVNPLCYNFALNQSDAQILDIGDDVQIIAWKNLLFSKWREEYKVDGKIKYRFINRILAGINTQIYSITSFDISKDLKEIYILNKDEKNKSSILVFKSNRSGNVSPRPINISSIKNARDIKLNSAQDKIVVLNDLSLISINANANSISTIKSKVPQSKNINTELINSKYDQLEIADQEIILLNKTDKKVISLGSNGIKKWEISTEDISLEDVQGIQFDSEKKSLIVFSKSKQLSFDLNRKPASK